MIEIDYKVTVWRRKTVTDEKVCQEVLKGIIEDNELHDTIADSDEILFETEEPMSIKDNGNQATVEVFYKGQRIYSNEGDF